MCPACVSLPPKPPPMRRHSTFTALVLQAQRVCAPNAAPRPGCCVLDTPTTGPAPSAARRRLALSR
jgi:hypothetical protein